MTGSTTHKACAQLLRRCVPAACWRCGRRSPTRNSQAACARPALTWSKTHYAPRDRKVARNISSGPRRARHEAASAHVEHQLALQVTAFADLVRLGGIGQLEVMD